MANRDPFNQFSLSQATLQDGTNTSNNWSTGVTSDYRSYNPANAKFASVATTRSSNFDPQRSFSNFYGNGRYGSYSHWLANSSQITTATANRISYLTPSGSRPSAYYWGQSFQYTDPTKAALVNQATSGLNFYRLSDGNKVILDQFKNDSLHWLYYNQVNRDNNLLTISNVGAVSKIEDITDQQDNTTNPTIPLLFQTHGGIPENGQTTWRTDYPRDSYWNSADRDTYIWYRPNFGSNVQIPENVETMGEWISNSTGQRSGS